MVNVFLTIDVEIWCNGWDNLDKNFSEAFQQYIYGTTPKGDYGLPIQLKMLQDSLGKIGKTFLVCLAPGKGSFYHEYFPDIFVLPKTVKEPRML